ncbi:MAG TPA: helix-turn-helix domain-containing protein [Hyphomicrobiales bacterium]|nr:helix-turn-helix domain-containing protein [Hyphomicrobiales bacterium]
MDSDLKQPSSLLAIVADQSPAMRRTCRKIIEAAPPGATQIREASTLHAVRVLLRDADAGLIIASDELAGGDGDLLVDAIRDTGAQGRIVLIARHAHGAAAASAGGPRAVEIVPRASVAKMLPALIEPAPALRANRKEQSAAKRARACEEEIVPFRVEERRIIETAIRRAGGNIGKAARALEISPSTIYRKIQVWQAERPA